jgi:glyoxylase-like metal-dependent hydrolase (beta-lactamase superfamily II)
MSTALTPDPPIAFAEASELARSQAGFHRVKVGGINITALSDGTVRVYQRDQLRNTTPEEVDQLLAKSYEKSPNRASMNSFLIEIGDRLLMVDVGAGEVLGPKLNKLSSSMSGIGLGPGDVTDILLTHIHPDHSGGLMNGGRKVFPNAKLHVNKKELEYWSSKENAARATGHTLDWFNLFEHTVRPYLADGSVQTYDGEVELFPGLRTVAAYGHTPGQVSYILEDGGEKIVFWGDLIHVPEVQFEVPTVTITFDVDQTQAAAQRLKSLADAAEHGYLVAMPHAHFPGVGHVRRDGTGYRWIPIPYVNDADGS